MTNDAFFHLQNQEFVIYLKNAVSAHQGWINNLEKMVRERVIVPLQLDSSKCGFGHFYNSITPNIPELRPIWDALGEKHKKFHGYGAKVLQALFDENYHQAEQICREVGEYSKELISDIEQMIQITNAR